MAFLVVLWIFLWEKHPLSIDGRFGADSRWSLGLDAIPERPWDKPGKASVCRQHSGFKPVSSHKKVKFDLWCLFYDLFLWFVEGENGWQCENTSYKEYLEEQVLMWLQGAKWPSCEDYEVESEDWGWSMLKWNDGKSKIYQIWHCAGMTAQACIWCFFWWILFMSFPLHPFHLCSDPLGESNITYNNNKNVYHIIYLDIWYIRYDIETRKQDLVEKPPVSGRNTSHCSDCFRR